MHSNSQKNGRSTGDDDDFDCSISDDDRRTIAAVLSDDTAQEKRRRSKRAWATNNREKKRKLQEEKLVRHIESCKRQKPHKLPLPRLPQPPPLHQIMAHPQQQQAVVPVEWESFSVDSWLADGGSSPVSCASSKADLTSPVPDFGDSTGGESRMHECNDLKDPDLCDGGDKNGLFNCLLDDMENYNWDPIVENTPLFADVFCEPRGFIEPFTATVRWPFTHLT